METLAGLPFIRLAADRDGSLAGGMTVDLPEDATDLIVISHGWKNSEKDAVDLYETLLGNVQQAAGAAFLDSDRRWVVAGVFWPAFRFQPDLSLLPEDGSAGVILRDDVKGGVQSLNAHDLLRTDLSRYGAEVGEWLGRDGETFALAAVEAAAGGAFATAFIKDLRDALTKPADLEYDNKAILCVPGAELVQRLATAGPAATLSFQVAERDASKGNAAGFKEVVQRIRQRRSGMVAAIATVLNQATYFEMKARAGVVGAAMAPVIEAAVREGVRVHLVGHSFGARLVSSLANSLTELRPSSMTLLQGAFSHNGFGSGTSRRIGSAGVDGVFRKVLTDGRVQGPIVVTHTRRDTAVGFYYPLASTLSGVIATSLGKIAATIMGGPDDRHGGLGANGALSLLPGEAEEHVALLVGDAVRIASRDPVSSPSTSVFSPGRVHNVLADAIICEHNDVSNPKVAALVWAAIR